MSGRWNPNDPLTIGLEWDARSASAVPVDYGQEFGALVTPVSTVAVTGAAFYAPGPPAGGSDMAFTAWNLVTVYHSGSERMYGPVRAASSSVNIAATSGGSLGGGAANALDAISSAADGKYITLDATDTLTVNFAMPDILTSTPRILDVKFSMVAAPAATGSELSWRYNGAGPTIAVTDIDGDSTYAVATGEMFLGGYDYVATPTDARRRVWLLGDLTNLASGALDLVITNSSGSTNIYWMGVEVTYCEENRVASGGLHRTSGSTSYPWVPGWQSGIQMIDVATGTAGFQAVAGREYLVTLTRASDVAADGMPRPANSAAAYYQTGLPRDVAALSPVDRSIVDAVSARRLTSGILASDVAAVDQAPAVVLLSSAGVAVEAMSEPYADVVSRSVSPVTQEVVSLFNALYSHVAVTARKFGAPGSLTVAVGGSTATLLPTSFDALDADPDGFARVVIPFNTPRSFTAGVEQSVSVTTSTGVDRWEVPVLSTVVTGSPYPAATYGGAAQVGQSDVKLDYAVTLLTAVPTVTGLAVGRGFLALAQADPDCPPGPLFRSMDYASICWGRVPVVSGSPAITGSPLVTGFCAWDVERADDIDPLWRRIARVTDPNILCLDDYEARIGVASHYRVRLCRTDGACGDWGVVSGFVRFGPSTADTAPVMSGSGCDGLVFTSNESPDSTVAYPYHFTGGAPTEGFTFLEASTVVVQRVHMRDYQVVFRPLERGGVRFSRTVMVNALTMPQVRLDEGFRSLRDLAWGSLTYVAVLDMRGGRWFAAVNVPEGSVREMNQLYLASVDVIETTDQPSVIDVVAV